jgi:glycosyltransferase involved in cell wall biosynthesis
VTEEPSFCGTLQTSVGIVIPVRNEEKLLPACLRSIAAALDRITLPSTLVLVLDRCTDRSAEIVEQFRLDRTDVRLLRSAGPGVGAARAAGIAELLAKHDPADLWIACSDADSEVPADWLVRQLAYAEAGADAVLGTVMVTDWSEQPTSVPLRYLAGYQAEPGHPHLHGANLSLHARAYLAAGGFDNVPNDEDLGLVRRLESIGARIVRAADLPVITSARLAGRAPAGFAGHLSELAELSDAVG